MCIDKNDRLAAKSCAVTVFPTPGVPVMRMFGRLREFESLSLMIAVLY